MSAVSTSYKVESKSLTIRKSDCWVPEGSFGFRFLHCFKSCFFYCRRLCTPWLSRSHAARVASFASSAYLWQGAKRCNPPMTNNVTARFCLRGCSLQRRGWQGGCKHREAVIERRGETLRGGCGRRRPCSWKYDENTTKWQETWKGRVSCSCILFSSSPHRIHA